MPVATRNEVMTETVYMLESTTLLHNDWTILLPPSNADYRTLLTQLCMSSRVSAPKLYEYGP